uniref:Uncharacterized protein n=1 Tax=Oryza barthii TaxID=65489 RepID=A0A0D3ENB7_9ORYZ
MLNPSWRQLRPEKHGALVVYWSGTGAPGEEESVLTVEAVATAVVRKQGSGDCCGVGATVLTVRQRRLDSILRSYNFSVLSVLPIYSKLIKAGLRIWFYSGDADGRVPVIGSRYCMEALGLAIKRDWQPWKAKGFYAVPGSNNWNPAIHVSAYKY